MHDSQRLISDWWLMAMHPVAHKGIVCDHCLHGSSHTVYCRKGGGRGKRKKGKRRKKRRREKKGRKKRKAGAMLSLFSPSSPSLSPLVPLPHFNGLGLR